MARGNYPRSRRIMMQVTMCVIFCASVGLAELVTRQRHGGGATQMSSAKDFGSVRIRFPDGWLMKRGGHGPIMFVAQEPDRPDRQGRSLTGRWDLAGQVSPLDFLQSGDFFDDSTRIIQTGAGTSWERVTMGTVPGVLLAVKRPIHGELQVEWVACCVLPSGAAVTLLLDCPMNDDLVADRQLLRDIASTMELKD